MAYLGRHAMTRQSRLPTLFVGRRDLSNMVGVDRFYRRTLRAFCERMALGRALREPPKITPLCGAIIRIADCGPKTYCQQYQFPALVRGIKRRPRLEVSDGDAAYMKRRAYFTGVSFMAKPPPRAMRIFSLLVLSALSLSMTKSRAILSAFTPSLMMVAW